LEAVNRLMAPEGTVYLMGCNTGRGDTGTALLVELSKIFKNKQVVAFITIGVSEQPKRQGITAEACQTPGMRATEYENPAQDDQVTLRAYGKEPRTGFRRLYNYPWASEASDKAKIAKNGVIAQNKEPRSGGTADYIKGTWEWDFQKKPEDLKPTDPSKGLF